MTGRRRVTFAFVLGVLTMLGMRALAHHGNAASEDKITDVAKNGNPAGRLQKIILADSSELHDTQLGGDAGGKTRYDPDADVKK